MLGLLRQSWLLLVVQGVAALMFGILAWVWPDKTLQGLVMLFGAYALIDGMLSLVGILGTAALGVAWWPLLLRGLAGIALGILTFAWPGVTALILLYLIAIWAVCVGIFQLLIGILIGLIFKQRLTGTWLLILGGIVSVVFGFWLVAAPGEGAIAVVWLIGTFAIAYGAILIAAGLRLRQLLAQADQLRGRFPISG